VILAAAAGTVLAQAPQPPTGQKFTLVSSLLRGYQAAQRNLLEAAEKMPEADYGFKATPEVKPFGQLVAHVALSQFGGCAAFKGEKSPKAGEKEDAPRSKAEAVALLKASTAFCDPLMTSMTDESLVQLTKVGNNEAAKGLILVSTNVHANEMYGTMAVYLRLKGIVPPTTARQNAPRTSQQ
jgi:hypothetical protein